MPAIPTPFQLVKVLVKARRQEKEIEGVQIEEEAKLSLFADGNERFQMLYPKTFRDDRKFRNIAKYRTNLQKSIAFLYANNKHTGRRS